MLDPRLWITQLYLWITWLYLWITRSILWISPRNLWITVQFWAVFILCEHAQKLNTGGVMACIEVDAGSYSALASTSMSCVRERLAPPYA